MRQISDKFIVTFPNTVAAMAMDAAASEDGTPGRLIPVPNRVHAGCGMCWCAEPEDEQAVRAEILARGIIVEEYVHLD